MQKATQKINETENQYCEKNTKQTFNLTHQEKNKRGLKIKTLRGDIATDTHKNRGS